MSEPLSLFFPLRVFLGGYWLRFNSIGTTSMKCLFFPDFLDMVHEDCAV